jgi:hypothetical protein
MGNKAETRVHVEGKLNMERKVGHDMAKSHDEYWDAE